MNIESKRVKTDKARLDKTLTLNESTHKYGAMNEVTNPEIVQSIHAYEKGLIVPTLFHIGKLKTILHA